MAVVSYYPLAYSRESRITPRPSFEFDMMADGSPAGREVAGVVVYDATIVHPMIKAADVAGLLQHYADHKRDVVRISYGGRSYDLSYVGEPEVQDLNGVRHRATVRLVGTVTPE